MSYGGSRLSVHVCALVVVSTIVLTAGCSGTDRPDTVPVSGVVTLGGQPLNAARVRFIPDDPAAGRTAIGDTDESGKFDLSTFEPGDGIVPGVYVADVTIPVDAVPPSSDPGSDISSKSGGGKAGGSSATVPEKYTDTKTSGLRYTFTDGDSGRTIEMKLE